jgi:hypothetical protein
MFHGGDINVMVTSENNDFLSWCLTITGTCCLHLQFRTNRDNLNTNFSSVLFKLSHEAELSLRIYIILYGWLNWPSVYGEPESIVVSTKTHHGTYSEPDESSPYHNYEPL